MKTPKKPPQSFESVIDALTTPMSVDSHVKRFCASLSATPPMFVDVVPEAWCRQSCCEMNVDKWLESNEGEKVVGYKIWYTQDKYLEAERHVVVRTPAGLRDLTFNTDGESQILFVADDGDADDYDARPLKIRRGVSLSGQKVEEFLRYVDAHVPMGRMSEAESWDTMLTYTRWQAGERQANFFPAMPE